MVYETTLAHYGVKGMKWGVRRYRNTDGSLTAAGVKRYQNNDGSLTDEGQKKYQDYKAFKKSKNYGSEVTKINDKYDKLEQENYKKRDSDPEYLKILKKMDKLNEKMWTADDATYGKLEKEYEKLQDEEDKIWRKYNDIGETYYQQRKSEYRKVLVKNLDLDNVQDGEALVKKFESMEFEEEYSKYRGSNY